MLNSIPQLLAFTAGAIAAWNFRRIWKTRTKLNPWIKGNGVSDGEKWLFGWRREWPIR